MKPIYNTELFKNIYPDIGGFMTAYKASNDYIPNKISDANAQLTYCLLMSKYAEAPIAYETIDQFKLRLFAIIFQFGPTWEKRLELQDKMRALSDDELRNGSTSIYNSSLNPAEEPTSHTTEELPYVNAQNVNKHKRSKADAYAILLSELRVDVTEEYLKRFTKLFRNVVYPDETYLYSDEDCEE